MGRKSKRAGTRRPQTDRIERLRLIFLVLIAIFALVGLADAAYLTIAHLSGETAVCGTAQGCSVVLGSAYASIHRIPTAALGAIAYFTVFSAATLAAYGYARARPLLVLTVGVMFVATLWFIYVQAFILRAFCPFCLLSAAVTFILTGLVIAMPPPARAVREKESRPVLEKAARPENPTL